MSSLIHFLIFFTCLQYAGRQNAHIDMGTQHRDLPAGHEDRLMGAKLLSVDHNGYIRQDISAAKPVQVEQNVACMAHELNAAICCTCHFGKIWGGECKKNSVSFRITWG